MPTSIPPTAAPRATATPASPAGPSMAKLVLVLLAVILLAIAVGAAILLALEKKNIVQELVVAREKAQQSATVASSASSLVARATTRANLLERDHKACLEKKTEIEDALEASQAKECKSKAAVPPKAKKPAAKPKKPTLPKAPLVAKPAVPATPASPPCGDCLPPPAKPAVPAPAPAPAPVPAPAPTALASAPCVADCAPRVTKSEPSKYCGLKFVSGKESWLLYLGELGGGKYSGKMATKMVSGNSKKLNHTLANPDTPASEGEMCDPVQTRAEQPAKLAEIMAFYGIPGDCKVSRVGGGSIRQIQP